MAMLVREACRDRLTRWLLHPLAMAMVGAAYILVLRHFDGRWRFVPFSIVMTMVLAGMVFTLSRRPRFAFYSAASIVSLQAFVSTMKYQMKGYSLHVLDFVHEASDPAALMFVVRFYAGHAVTAATLALIAAIVLRQVYRLERPMAVRPAMRVFPALLFSTAAFAAHPEARADDPPFVFGLNASSLFLSLAQTPQLFGPTPLARRLQALDSAETLPGTPQCGPAGKQPDLMLVLAESQAAPDLLARAGLASQTLETYRSADGTVRPLFVETYGAGTWMTNFSVLTGLSTADFSWQGPYVNQLYENRIGHALPQLLADCGYRTVAIIPMKGHTLNEAPFLRSIGFSEIHDAEMLGTAELGLRDRVFYDYAEQLIAAHRATSRQPLFIHIQGIFPHSPYNISLVPDGEVPERLSADGALNEYLRRLTLARRDFTAFRERRSDNSGPAGTVLLEFGDHQSIATAATVAAAQGQATFGDYRSNFYRTFFSVHAFGTPLRSDRLGPDGDAAFLAARLLAATDLPRSPVFSDLARLNDLCFGRYHSCRERSAIDMHLKMRVDAGMLALN